MTPEDPAKGEDGSSIGIPPVPPGPPPGTETLTFWQRSGTRTAIVTTVGSALAVARGLILGVPLSRETLATLLEGNVWAWLAAAGIAAVGGVAIRKAP